MRVLVTGGRGELGSLLVPRLQQAGHTVRIMSRSARPTAVPAAGPQPAAVAAGMGPTRSAATAVPTVEWAQADLRDAASLATAVAGVDAVVHAASSALRDHGPVDVDGTRRLADAARAAGVRHFVYVSIVGVDRIPLSYFRAKHEAEQVVAASGVPYSLLRATQFHSLLARPLEALGRLPVRLVPAGFRFQPVASSEVADRLAAIVEQEPAGRLPDFGGPEVRTTTDLARAWARVRGRRVLIVPVPLPGAGAAALRAGWNLCPDHAAGRITWEEYLNRCE